MEKRNRFFTIPNLMTVVRILLIPVFVVLYLQKEYIASLAVIVASGLSDVFDGMIARRFDQVSDVGKILDPIADKLSQMAVMFMLAFVYPIMWIPLGFIVVKEITTGIVGIVATRRVGEVRGAVWHGKVTTVFLYITFGIHLLWPIILPDKEMPKPLSYALVFVCVGLMLMSFILYLIRYAGMIREGNEKKAAGNA